MHLKLTAVGRLGKDPEAKTSKDGKVYVTFSLACTDSKKQTTWVNAIVFGKAADSCSNYLSKGSLVLVEGTPKLSAYTDKKSGEAKASLELFVDTVRFLSSSNKNESNSSADSDSEIPF